jgi:hypothetical protein
MFHDSFARKLKPFLSQHFSRIVYLRDWGFHFHAFITNGDYAALKVIANSLLMGLQKLTAGKKRSQTMAHDYYHERYRQ